MKTKRPYVVGLTGGIGSGKSTVATLFQAAGAGLIDTDEIAHTLTRANGEVMPAIAAAFGDDVVAADGSLNRPMMRTLVFGDNTAKKKLEAILHPLIRQRTLALLDACSEPYVLLAVPLLVESRAYRSLIDRVAVVDCPEETQISRVMVRSGLSADEVRAIMAQQVSRATRLAHADDVIDNSGAPEKLDPQVAQLDLRYRQLAAHRLN